jgi:hypothetical protein
VFFYFQSNPNAGAGSQQGSESWPDSSSPDSEASNHDNDILRAKRGHVLAELLETERIYVREIAMILKVYSIFFKRSWNIKFLCSRATEMSC